MNMFKKLLCIILFIVNRYILYYHLRREIKHVKYLFRIREKYNDYHYYAFALIFFLEKCIYFFYSDLIKKGLIRLIHHLGVGKMKKKNQTPLSRSTIFEKFWKLKLFSKCRRCRCITPFEKIRNPLCMVCKLHPN